MKKRILQASTVVFVFWAGGAWATMWDESVDGDLSNDRMAPTLLTLTTGSNSIRGGFGAPDLDYLTLVVPVGYSISAIVTGIHNNLGLSSSFLGVQAGAVMTVPPNAADATGLLGWTHFRGASGVDLLPAMSIARFGSTGFTPPLAAGSYTFWINETLADPGLTFDLDFQLTAAAPPVPLPASAWLLGTALVSLIGLRTPNARRNLRGSRDATRFQRRPG